MLRKYAKLKRLLLATDKGAFFFTKMKQASPKKKRISIELQRKRFQVQACRSARALPWVALNSLEMPAQCAQGRSGEIHIPRKKEKLD